MRKYHDVDKKYLQNYLVSKSVHHKENDQTSLTCLIIFLWCTDFDTR